MLEKSTHKGDMTSPKMSEAPEYWKFNFLTHCEITMLTNIEEYLSKEAHFTLYIFTVL